ITGRHTGQYLPRGEGDAFLRIVAEKAKEVLSDHPVNRVRLAAGKKPANAIWLWGQGRAPQVVKLTERYRLQGSVISAVDLLNGIGVYAGLRPIRVPGATGYIDTNYVGKARAAIASLREGDFVFVHAEAPDEMGHEGNVEGKIKAIEDFDEKVVGEILAAMPSLGPTRLLVLSDHPTPLVLKTHAADPSPFAVLSNVAAENLGGGLPYDEQSARASGIVVSPGYTLTGFFLGNWGDFLAQYRSP
ncbi:MAG: phosphoglycerate mutase, partial [Syntrophales bacterium]|nr:phosphoglycerate mutase [Syntrophales bacterium]